MSVTEGQLLKCTLTSAWPRPLLAETCTTTEADVDAPWLSVTVKVRAWSPSAVGAVQTVVAMLDGAKPSGPGLVDQAKAIVSSVFGSCAVALAETLAPGTTLLDESTRASMTGTAFLKGAEAAVC